MISVKEFEEKKARLMELARSVDLWESVPMSNAKKERVMALWQELGEQLSEIEVKYLEIKLEKFEQIYKEMKA